MVVFVSNPSLADVYGLIGTIILIYIPLSIPLKLILSIVDWHFFLLLLAKICGPVASTYQRLCSIHGPRHSFLVSSEAVFLPHPDPRYPELCPTFFDPQPFRKISSGCVGFLYFIGSSTSKPMPYVDKTSVIRTFIKLKGSHLLLRPRGAGKSSLLRTLRFVCSLMRV